MRLHCILNQLRTRFWLVQGRQTVKKHICHCVICKHYKGTTLLQPQSPDLRAFRLCTDNAFANVGLDHAGTLFVKNIYDTSTEMHKAYILLLTCSTAIHLESVPDVSGPATV